jgi:hypothetical protein
MRFTRFKITNFRGIKHVELALDRQPQTNVYTLVGLNESGKSTILHALHWFREPSGYIANDLMPKALRANFNGQVSVKAWVDVSAEDDAEIGRILAQHGYTKVDAISEVNIERQFTFVHSTVQTQNFIWSLLPQVKKQKGRKNPITLKGNDAAWQALVKHIQEHMLPPIVYYENFLFDFPDRIYVDWATGAMPAQQVQYRHVLQDVLTSLGMGLTIEKHLVERHESGERADLENIQAVLDQAGAQLTDVVITAWRQIVKSTDQKLEVTLGHGLETDDKGTYVQLKVKEGKHTFYIRERSLGFRWFFGFILFTHFRTFRDNSRRNALFLLDEPASNLHPAAQTKLLSAFDALPNNQLVIYSTHSHHMINPAWLSGAYVIRNAGHSYQGLDLGYNASMTDVQAQRYYHFAAQHPDETDLYRPILDALEHRPGPLEKIPDLVVVEGKNDYFTLHYMAEVQKLGSVPNVFPATGADKVDYVVALYLGWGRNFIVLVDDDRAGRATSARLVRQFGDVVKRRVFSLADVDSSWAGMSMEDLFDAPDQEAVTGATFPGASYEKSKFNTSLARLYIEKGSIAISKPTTARFKRLLKFCEKQVADLGSE